MPKVLLVEDDNNLREIFEMRLQAEGYQTVTAGDGEEGLTVAMKEKPDLIIADIMMPKLSGFEMLETLRAAPDMKDTKVIMMTALGQAEDRARGESLGVVKYLVKSQATLEDFARVVEGVLPVGQAGQTTAEGTSAESSQNNNLESEKSMQEDQTPTNPTTPGGDSAAPSTPPSNPVSGDAPADSGQMGAAEEQSAVQSQIDNFAGSAPAGDTGTPAAATDSSTPAWQPTSGGDSSTPATPGAPDVDATGDSTSTEPPSMPQATPPADNPPATPPVDSEGDSSGPNTPGAPAS